MHSGEVELVLVALMAAFALLMVAAQAVRVPYPIFFVLGGTGLAFVPGLPDARLSPDLVLLLFLPPLLYSAAFFSSLRDLRANLRPIGLLSFGLVLATAVLVAVAAHYAIGLDWAPAFVLGAIVSPTDPIAATSIARRLGVPRRVATIVEGESLINDATALVAYRFAVAATVTGAFSLGDAVLRFAIGAVGGVAVGLACGWLVRQVRRRLDDPPTEIAISILTAYFAYLPAEALGLSGVLAAVSVGIYMGWHAPQLITPDVRLQSFGVWSALTFILNAVLFILIGLQLPFVLEGLRGEPPGRLALEALLVCAVVIGARILWVFPLTYVPRRLSRRIRERSPAPPWRSTLLVAWTGMRGAVTLAAALALPLETEAGAPFPARDRIVFLAFCVILATLLLQGLSLPTIIHWLGIRADDHEEQEEVEARRRAAEAALARVEELGDEEWVREDSAERLRALYDYRRRRFAARAAGDGERDGFEARTAAYARLRLALLDAERRALIGLRRSGEISDDVMRRIERDLDLEQQRIEG